MPARTILSASILWLAASLSAHAADCTRTSTGLVPLTELAAPGYMGEAGGLYPGGVNQPPAAQWDAAIRAGRTQVVPRDAAGAPDPVNGIVALLSVGMSNTTQEYQAFLSLAAADPSLDPHLRLVDGAIGARDVAAWLSPTTDVWTTVAQRLAAANVSAEQVQAIWMKQALAGPANYGAFPAHAQVLGDDLALLIGQLGDRFPNLRLLYLSSRIYAGYASTMLNPEPYAYESGFSVRWTIERQIGGAPELNADPSTGPVEAPWLLWGPYLWADGLTPRADGLTWDCSDFANDGTHPATSGRAKVGQALLDFLGNEPSSRPWFLSPVTLRVARSATDVLLTWQGAAAPWRVERSDDPRGPWTAVDPASPLPSHADPDVGSGVRLRCYGIW